MLPYVEFPTIGPITCFGILAMMGAYLGQTACVRHAAKSGLDVAHVRRMVAWCGIGGVLGGHYIDLFLYQPGWYHQPDAVWRFINPFAGLSSYGGFIGGTLGFIAWGLKNRVARLRYADAMLVCVIVLMTFGRAGCASVHDHVGVATSFPLAVDFPAGNPTGVVGPHHDLGLYELGLWLVLLPLAFVLLRTPRRPGWIVAVIATAYAIPRFFLELLRREASDPHYAGLTPAQWSSIATLVAAGALFAWVYTRPSDTPQPAT